MYRERRVDVCDMTWIWISIWVVQMEVEDEEEEMGDGGDHGDDASPHHTNIYE